MKIDIGDFESPFCRGGGHHIKTGDLFVSIPAQHEYREFDNYCFPCALALGNKKIRGICKKANTNVNLLQKRSVVLEKYSKHRRQVLGLVAWNWKYREVEAASERIRYECLEETWLQRLDRIFKEQAKINSIEEVVVKVKKAKAKNVKAKKKSAEK